MRSKGFGVALAAGMTIVACVPASAATLTFEPGTFEVVSRGIDQDTLLIQGFLANTTGIPADGVLTNAVRNFGGRFATFNFFATNTRPAAVALSFDLRGAGPIRIRLGGGIPDRFFESTDTFQTFVVPSGGTFFALDSTSPFTLDNIVVANPAAVPEPATWAMMIAGFGLAGVSMRRRSIIGRAAA